MLDSIIICVTIIVVMIFAIRGWKYYNALYMFYCFYSDIIRLEEKIVAIKKGETRVPLDDVMFFNALELMCQYSEYGMIKREWIKNAFGGTIKHAMEQVMNPNYPERVKDADMYRSLKKIYQSLYEKGDTNGAIY